MDAKDITSALLKIAGLVTFAYAIFQIPSYFPPAVGAGAPYSICDSVSVALATLALPIVFGVLLWFFPATITNKIVSGQKLSGSTFGAPEFERVALTILGMWLVAYGITDLVAELVSIVYIRQNYPDITALPPRVFAMAIASVVKLCLGLVLVFGARSIMKFVARVGGGG
jgi:hypothetical protein